MLVAEPARRCVRWRGCEGGQSLRPCNNGGGDGMLWWRCRAGRMCPLPETDRRGSMVMERAECTIESGEREPESHPHIHCRRPGVSPGRSVRPHHDWAVAVRAPTALGVWRRRPCCHTHGRRDVNPTGCFTDDRAWVPLGHQPAFDAYAERDTATLARSHHFGAPGARLGGDSTSAREANGSVRNAVYGRLRVPALPRG